MPRNRRKHNQNNEITYKTYASAELDDLLGSDGADKVIDDMLMHGCDVEELFARFGLALDEEIEMNTKQKHANEPS